MKKIFVIGANVVGIASVAEGHSVVATGPAGSMEYDADDSDPTQLGWTFNLVNGRPVFSQSAQPSAPPTVSPMTFKMLWTSAERIAIKTARLTDPVIEDFMSIVEAPQLTEIIMSLRSVQDGIEYTLTKINSSDPVGRLAEILTGVLK